MSILHSFSEIVAQLGELPAGPAPTNFGLKAEPGELTARVVVHQFQVLKITAVIFTSLDGRVAHRAAFDGASWSTGRDVRWEMSERNRGREIRPIHGQHIHHAGIPTDAVLTSMRVRGGRVHLLVDGRWEEYSLTGENFLRCPDEDLKVLTSGLRKLTEERRLIAELAGQSKPAVPKVVKPKTDPVAVRHELALVGAEISGDAAPAAPKTTPMAPRPKAVAPEPAAPLPPAAFDEL